VFKIEEQNIILFTLGRLPVVGCDSSPLNKSKELAIAIDDQLFFRERDLWTNYFFMSGSIGQLFIHERGPWTSSFFL
jgi:hypothetical protein